MEMKRIFEKIDTKGKNYWPQQNVSKRDINIKEN
jgi:hypothetical protein